MEVEENELRARLLKRGETSGRPDDVNPEIIQNRINVYQRETTPVADHYKAQDKYHGVDGIGSIEEIADRLCVAIDSAREKA